MRYDRRIARLVISLASGLENARPADLVDAEISPSGLGVHFPKLDADIYIPALLEGFLGSKRWMASEMGKVGGKAERRACSVMSSLKTASTGVMSSKWLTPPPLPGKARRTL